MSNKKIGIYTLTAQRDRNVDRTIATELRKLGHEVDVRSYINGAIEAVCYEKPDAIVHPLPGGEYKMDFIRQCKDWGIEIIVRRGEAGIGKEQWVKLSDNRQKIMLGNWDYSPYVDLELTWGQEFTDILAEHGHMPADKMKPCGAFVFDTYFQDECQRDNISPRKPTILFATGFSGADSREEYTECGLEEGCAYQGELYRLHCAARETWIEAIKELVRWFSDSWNFEIKVRPGEITSQYKITFQNDANVKVLEQLVQSADALRRSDILVHSGSTMAIEAHLLGIPSFNFCNVNPDPLLANASPQLKNYRELEFHLMRVPLGQSNINLSVFHKLKEHLYGNIDGKASYRAAHYIHEHLKDKNIKTSIPNYWPKTTNYHIDKENTHLRYKKGDQWWLCVCCRKQYFTTPRDRSKCPYCGMTTSKMIKGRNDRTDIMVPILK